jgi:hypothetical protein
MATTAPGRPASVSAADDEDALARESAIRHTLTSAAVVLTSAIEAVHLLDPTADPIAIFNRVLRGDLGRQLRLVPVH